MGRSTVAACAVAILLAIAAGRAAKAPGTHVGFRVGGPQLLGNVDFVSPRVGWVEVSRSPAYHPGYLCTNPVRTGCERATTVVYRTVDGGRTWKTALRIDSPPFGTGPVDLPGLWMRFFNDRDGLVAQAASTSRLGLYHTDDGGASWVVSPLPRDTLPVSTEISFVDPRHGWLLRQDGGAAGFDPVSILRTRDGVRWQLVACTSLGGGAGLRLCPKRNFPLDHDEGTISFRSRAVGWVTATDAPGRPMLATTFDGGVHWAARTLPWPLGVPTMSSTGNIQPYATPQQPIFLSSRAGLLPAYVEICRWKHPPYDVSAKACPIYLYAYETSDGGKSWGATQRLPGRSGDLIQPEYYQFLDAHHWWVGVHGTIWRTRNGGRSWTRLRPTFPRGFVPVKLDFVSPEKGWALAAAGIGDEYPRATALLHTTDGGSSWQVVSVPEV